MKIKAVKKYCIIDGVDIRWVYCIESGVVVGIWPEGMYEVGNAVEVQLEECEGADQLVSYFSGQRSQFDIRCKFHYSLFQCRVYEEVMKIGYGSVKNYGEIAKALGGIQYSRAVGHALSLNQIMIVMPCHRVVGKKGLVGFAAGVDVKSKLLSLEGGI